MMSGARNLGGLLGAARFPKLNKLTLCAMDSPQDGLPDILRDSCRCQNLALRCMILIPGRWVEAIEIIRGLMMNLRTVEIEPWPERPSMAAGRGPGV